MKLLVLVIKEFLAIVKHLEAKDLLANGKIIIPSKSFYALLDTNLYIKRKEKLDIYRNLNFIVCGQDSFTNVVYDRKTKKTSRKIIINYGAYKTIKRLYETEFLT